MHILLSLWNKLNFILRSYETLLYTIRNSSKQFSINPSTLWIRVFLSVCVYDLKIFFVHGFPLLWQTVHSCTRRKLLTLWQRQEYTAPAFFTVQFPLLYFRRLLWFDCDRKKYTAIVIIISGEIGNLCFKRDDCWIERHYLAEGWLCICKPYRYKSNFWEQFL